MLGGAEPSSAGEAHQRDGPFPRCVLCYCQFRSLKHHCRGQPTPLAMMQLLMQSLKRVACVCCVTMGGLVLQSKVQNSHLWSSVARRGHGAGEGRRVAHPASPALLGRPAILPCSHKGSSSLLKLWLGQPKKTPRILAKAATTQCRDVCNGSRWQSTAASKNAGNARQEGMHGRRGHHRQRRGPAG